ncbi:gamma-glutamylcyclotransferase [Devosia rhodophyticola]
MSESPSRSTSYWVFGYGSLIWNPGFAFLRAERATLWGAHRSLSVYSHHYRGTEAQPGLVFGLARGGSCRGMAFEVAADQWDETIGYLRARELITHVYREAERPICLASGGRMRAVTYLVDEHHVQYAGKLSLVAQAEMVRLAIGQSGPNIDYVLNTAQHLRELGIGDRTLDALVRLLGRRPD